VQNLYRVKNALGIRDNDALWLVLMALGSYNTLYCKYPSIIATQVETLVDTQKEVLAAVANTEARKALGSLFEAVGWTSEAMAVKLVDAARWQAWGWTLIGLVAFGCLCLCVGVAICSGRLPFWVATRSDSNPTLSSSQRWRERQQDESSPSVALPQRSHRLGKAGQRFLRIGSFP
jgi:hypothetical protein